MPKLWRCNAPTCAYYNDGAQTACDYCSAPKPPPWEIVYEVMEADST
jgi:hypothetical protein